LYNSLRVESHDGFSKVVLDQLTLQEFR